MLADTAIAVNPTDERYKVHPSFKFSRFSCAQSFFSLSKKFHGKFAVHPFNGRKIPIICDAELVKDITLGSGKSYGYNTITTNRSPSKSHPHHCTRKLTICQVLLRLLQHTILTIMNVVSGTSCLCSICSLMTACSPRMVLPSL